MAYMVSISPWNSSLDDPCFFIGTGFWGEKFSSWTELKSLFEKYAMYTDKTDGSRRFYPKIKVTFHLASTIDSMKAEGNRQAKEDGIVNLFAVAAAGRNDPLAQRTFYWWKRGFRDPAQPNDCCHWAYIDRFNGQDEKPKFIHSKFSEYLHDYLGLPIDA